MIINGYFRTNSRLMDQCNQKPVGSRIVQANRPPISSSDDNDDPVDDDLLKEITPKINRAYHEAGHTVCGWFLPNAHEEVCEVNSENHANPLV